MPLLRPLDPAFPIDRQLAVDATPVVLVNLVTLDKADEPRFLEAWQSDAAFMKRQPGFISTQLHRAIGDSSAYVNYAVWESTAHYRTAFTHPEFKASLAAYPSSVVAIPHLFQKVAVPGICVAWFELWQQPRLVWRHPFDLVGFSLRAAVSASAAATEHEEDEMKVALLGATGFVGSALLKEALDRGHVVTAIVPDPEKLEEREGLTAKAGDVYDTASLATLIRGNGAIISAFNPGWKNPNLYDDQVRGTTSIIAAIKKAGIKRVLWVGGAGGLEVTPGIRFVDSPDMPLWVKPGALATINALDQLRKEPELEWSYLSPSAELTPEQRTGKFRLGNDQLLVDATGQSKISVQDYAVAMIDELERPTRVRQRFTAGY